jgi:hypothetical protein
VFTKFLTLIWGAGGGGGGGIAHWPPLWVHAYLFEGMEMAYYDKWILELFQGNLYVELK